MFSYSLTYQNQEGREAGMIGGCETLAGTIADCAKMVAYYRDLHYTVAIDYVRECCPDCSGAGNVANKRNKFLRKPCKACKGSGAKQILKSA